MCSESPFSCQTLERLVAIYNNIGLTISSVICSKHFKKARTPQRSCIPGADSVGNTPENFQVALGRLDVGKVAAIFEFDQLGAGTPFGGYLAQCNDRPVAEVDQKVDGLVPGVKEVLAMQEQKSVLMGIAGNSSM